MRATVDQSSLRGILDIVEGTYIQHLGWEADTDEEFIQGAVIDEKLRRLELGEHIITA